MMLNTLNKNYVSKQNKICFKQINFRQCIKKSLKVYNVKTTFKDSGDRYNNNINYLNNLFYNHRTSFLSGEELSILITTKFGNKCNVEIVTKNKTTYLHFKDEISNHKMSYYNEIATLINSYGDPDNIRNMILHSDIKIIGGNKILMELPILEVEDI